MLDFEAYSEPRQSVDVRGVVTMMVDESLVVGGGGFRLSPAENGLVAMVVQRAPKILPKKDFFDLVEDSL